MAKCRECKQTFSHKMSCSRRKHGGRTWVTSEDENQANWSAGAVYPDSSYSSYSESSGGGGSCDSSSSSSSGGGCE